jgi:hypothetical protein
MYNGGVIQEMNRVNRQRPRIHLAVDIRQVVCKPLEPLSGSRTVRKRVAPPPKYDVNGCECLIGATRLLFLHTVQEPLSGSSGSHTTFGLSLCTPLLVIESLSPSGMPLFSFFPLKGINKVQ